MKTCVGVVWKNIKYFGEVWSLVVWDLANHGMKMFKGKLMLIILDKYFNTCSNEPQVRY